MSESDSIAIVVPPELDGERADRIVAITAGVSRALARRIIEAGDAVGIDAPSARLGGRHRVRGAPSRAGSGTAARAGSV